MIDLDLVMRGFAEYPKYGYIAFASLAMNYLVFGFLTASFTREKVDELGLHPMWLSFVQMMQMLLWPILVGMIIALITLLTVISYLSRAENGTDDIEVGGLFNKK